MRKTLTFVGVFAGVSNEGGATAANFPGVGFAFSSSEDESSEDESFLATGAFLTG